MKGIELNTVLQISTVVVSLAVVSAPILYPKYSVFVRRAYAGLAQLQQERSQHDEVQLGYVERGEKGFKELLEVIELTFGYSGEPDRICLAIGNPKDLGDFTGFGVEYGIGTNGILYAEAEKNRELLRWEPWSPGTTLKLEKMTRGITLRARERSHFVTITLAVLWATLSIVTVI